MSKIGEKLKTEREKKGLSLHEVGMGLKINPKILKAIEDDDQKNLPAKTFLRGFIRSYAQYLRLDIDQILRQFQDEMGTTRPEEIRPPIIEERPVLISENASAPTKPAKTDQQKNFQRPEGFTSRKLYTIFGSLVLLFFIIFIAKMVDKYQKESRRVTVETPNPIIPEETPLPPVDTSIPDAGLMTPISTPLAASGAEAIDSTTPSPTPVLAVAVPTPTPKPNTLPTLTPLPTVTMTPALTATPALTPTPSPTEVPAAKAKPIEVIVEALNKVTIRYSFGDDTFETLSLMPDEFHTIKSKGILNLEISDGGAVSLVVNGRDRGVPGTIGKPLKLSFPK